MAEQNPPTSEILRNHELASRTINQHGTALEIFDQSELNLLRRFVVDTSDANRTQILKDSDMYDGPDATGQELGSKAGEKNSLAGFVIARYGKVAESTINDDEVLALKNWFAAGGGQ